MGNQSKDVPENSEKNFKVWWDEENRIIRHWSQGKNNEKIASDSTVEIKTHLAEHPDALGLMIDISDVSTVNVGGRKIYAEFVASLDKKVAFYGANRVMQVVVQLIFTLADNLENLKIMSTESEALEWLKKGL